MLATRAVSWTLARLKIGSYVEMRDATSEFACTKPGRQADAIDELFADRHNLKSNLKDMMEKSEAFQFAAARSEGAKAQSLS